VVATAVTRRATFTRHDSASFRQLKKVCAEVESGRLRNSTAQCLQQRRKQAAGCSAILHMDIPALTMGQRKFSASCVAYSFSARLCQSKPVTWNTCGEQHESAASSLDEVPQKD
jgi:hypothetical protein